MEVVVEMVVVEEAEEVVVEVVVVVEESMSHKNSIETSVNPNDECSRA